ncbi:glycosyltransferase family 2 protein [Cognatishimia maritima]|uniref:Glycosyltransferase, GT2 family n=1 Tax=Cognatishimia maritima TaxID=870908 RepID=A0A1M5IH40_9RHOB|nr:glycosyltransferase family 2 protein [Cognatishimia maritima]SHG27113.1 Glycosyltransferase, GT2 family [Cognatishimia maritima]
MITDSNSLSWTLAICTYNRPQHLLPTLGFIATQHRLPLEIVVVDASDDWEKTRAEVRETYPDLWDKVALRYEPADVRSLTAQRNQALRLAQGDIVFSLDDDIHLFPDTAEKIMQAYEADQNEDISMIGAFFVEPGPDAVADTSDAGPLAPVEHGSFKQRVEAWLRSQFTLDKHFVPYWAPLTEAPLPDLAISEGLLAGGLINGGRTTFRRKFALNAGWSEFLRYYATHEDSDFSYRMAQMGRLAVMPAARLFHADGNEGLYRRYRVNVIRVRNLMALHRVHSDNRQRSAFRLATSFLFFAALYALIDPMQKRLTFPTMRAYLAGFVQIPWVLYKPTRDFKKWYIDLQERMYQLKD